MRLPKDLGKATFIQFGVMSLLSIPAGLSSIISTCASDKGDCVSNTLVSVIFYVLIVVWFGLVTAVGYAAQEKRKQWITGLLVFAELGVVFVTSINIRGHSDIFGTVASVADMILAIWIISIALRLSLKRGGRIVSGQRSRKRKS